MNNNHLKMSYLARRMTKLNIGPRLMIGMTSIIIVMTIPIILLISASIRNQESYNHTLDNLNDISMIVQSSRNQGYRIIDYCTMNRRIEDSGETEIIVSMMECVGRIRANIGNDPRYKKNQQTLDIVDNLLTNYAESYKIGTQKCGTHFNLSGDTEFYSMVDTANFINANCNDLLSLEMNRSRDLKEEISANSNRMLILISLFGVTVIIAMIGLVYVMMESITYPLERLMSHMEQISRSGLIDKARPENVAGSGVKDNGEEES